MSRLFRTQILLGLIMLVALPIGAWGQFLLLVNPPPIDPKLLQGAWKGMGPGGECEVTISGETLRYEQPDGGGAEEFWFETTLVVPEGSEPQQFYATIVADSSDDSQHVGKTVVALFKLVDGTLSLGVVDSSEEAPKEPLEVTWDDVLDEYTLKRKPEATNNATP